MRQVEDHLKYGAQIYEQLSIALEMMPMALQMIYTGMLWGAWGLCWFQIGKIRVKQQKFIISHYNSHRHWCSGIARQLNSFEKEKLKET